MNYLSLEEDKQQIKLAVHYFEEGEDHWASYREISKNSQTKDITLHQIVIGLRELARLVERNLTKENYGRQD